MEAGIALISRMSANHLIADHFPIPKQPIMPRQEVNANDIFVPSSSDAPKTVSNANGARDCSRAPLSLTLRTFDLATAVSGWEVTHCL